MSEKPSQAEIEEAIASHAQEVELQNASWLVEWMKREMPEGTIIGNPEWWAMKIYRRFVAAERAAREKAEAKLAELENQGPAMNIRDGQIKWSQVPVGYTGVLFFEPTPPAAVAELQKRMAELEAEKKGLVQSIINMQQAGAELERKLAEQQASARAIASLSERLAHMLPDYSDRANEITKISNGMVTGQYADTELAALLSAEREAGRKEAVPDGWQVVPKVVVGKMGTYLCNCDSENGMTPETCTAQDALNGLLAAAPTPEGESK